MWRSHRQDESGTGPELLQEDVEEDSGPQVAMSRCSSLPLTSTHYSPWAPPLPSSGLGSGLDFP